MNSPSLLSSYGILHGKSEILCFSSFSIQIEVSESTDTLIFWKKIRKKERLGKVYEVFERMAFSRISSTLFMYMTTKLHQDTVVAANNVTNWIGTFSLTPIIGPYVADAVLGRYWTFVIASAIYLSKWWRRKLKSQRIQSLRRSICLIITPSVAEAFKEINSGRKPPRVWKTLFEVISNVKCTNNTQSFDEPNVNVC